MNQSWTVPVGSCHDIGRKTAGTPFGAVGRGLAAGAAGTLAIRDYDRETLAKDLTAHLVYGTAAAALRLLSPLTRHPRHG